MSISSKAAEFAKERFKGIVDDEGKDYFEVHCAVVGEILKLVTQDEEIIAAGYLHDLLEDTKTTYEEIEQNFGKHVADIVSEVTWEKDEKTGLKYFPRLHSQEGIMVKFADRLSNISRMNAWPKDRQESYLKRSKFWKKSLDS